MICLVHGMSSSLFIFAPSFAMLLEDLKSTTVFLIAVASAFKLLFRRVMQTRR